MPENWCKGSSPTKQSFYNDLNVKYVRIIKECENTETPKFSENTKLLQKSQMW